MVRRGTARQAWRGYSHNVVERDLWVPHSICIGGEVIRLFDTQVHQRASFSPPQPWKLDQRWVRIRRPFVVAGGEMTIESLEMAYSSSRGSYEAPLHIKSNGGTFMIDDLGRQRIEPSALLNRWIIPLEHGFDYFSLHSGHKIKVPFQQMLIVATNLDPERVMDPAFLRRMGYRVHLSTPGPERYQEIFHKYASRWRGRAARARRSTPRAIGARSRASGLRAARFDRPRARHLPAPSPAP